MNATFPSDFVPTLKHNIIKNLNITDQYTLHTASLYRFLNFTHKLEMMVVNAVTANIALGLYDLVSTRGTPARCSQNLYRQGLSCSIFI